MASPLLEMECALGSQFGNEDVLTMGIQPKPTWKAKSKMLLIKVYAVSLSPSDYRIMSGDADYVKKPKQWPYIPGGDVCGVVEESDTPGFNKGDAVIGTWEMAGYGALAEYTLIQSDLASLKPPSISFCDGAALANSASHAMFAVKKADIKPGSRVLVIGGSGGVGSMVVQMARNAGAAFIAVTSTNTDLVKSLGADLAIDYRDEKWWLNNQIRAQPLDAVIDCAEGVTAWRQARAAGVLKTGRRGGKWVAVVPENWDIVMHRLTQVLAWGFPTLYRWIWTRLFSRWTPKWIMNMADVNGETIATVCDHVVHNNLRVVCDPAGPFPFTEKGVRDAFRLHKSRRAQGKVVIQIKHDSD
eukprot:m.258318 g.258318  ORF g.258318 m.258318 type:complete len:357 (+) comp36416_c0_seq1:384-1454(+)